MYKCRMEHPWIWCILWTSPNNIFNNADLNFVLHSSKKFLLIQMIYNTCTCIYIFTTVEQYRTPVMFLYHVTWITCINSILLLKICQLTPLFAGLQYIQIYCLILLLLKQKKFENSFVFHEAFSNFIQQTEAIM